MDITLNTFNYNRDIDKQRDLFKECFPENINTSTLTKKHYYWKFHSFPNEKTSFEYGAYKNDDLIGYYAALPYQYKFFNKNVTIGMVCDVMTGIKARGKGVFTKIGIYSTNKLKENNLFITTGYPIRPNVIPGHLKAGWEQVFDLPLYIKFIKFDSLLKKKKLSFLLPFFNITVKLFLNIKKLNKSAKNDIRVEIYSQNDIDKISGLSIFIDNWINSNNISLLKDEKFLKWRLGAPQKKYNLLVLRNHNSIKAFAITRKIVKEGIPCLAILDLMIYENDRKIIRKLHKELENLATTNNAEAIIIMSSKFCANRYKLFNNLFLKSPYKFQLIIKNLNAFQYNDKLFNEKNWHLMWIDSDDL